MTPIDPFDYNRLQNSERQRHTDIHGHIPYPEEKVSLIKLLISYLVDEVPPIYRHLRAGALMVAAIMIVSLVSDVLADPQLYAAIVIIASLIEGVVGQVTKAMRNDS